MPVSVPRPTRFSFCQFELDLTSGELYKNGEKVALPRKAFEILRVLAERPGEVVTREELRAQLWAADTFVEFDDNLNHAVNKLRQVLGDSAENGSAKTFTLAGELLARLKTWKQLTEFSGAEDWIFASPVKIGRLPYSYTGVWRELVRAAAVARIGHLGTHAFRHSYRSWLDAVGTPVAVQQKMMRHADIRTTFNIYGDVVTDEMTTASSKVAQLAFPSNGTQTERNEG